jgi:hypothetical protein
MMSKFIEIIKHSLPTIATAMGGPLAGLAAGFVADKLGVSDKTIANISEVLTKASSDPATMLELKRIDIDLQKFFANMEVDLEKVHSEDRDSARNREVQTKDNTPKILAYVVTAGFFGILSWILFKGFPKDNTEVVIYMLGSLSTAWTGVMAYYYGTTKSSADKTTILANSLRGK